MENRIDMHIVKQRLLHVLAGVVMISGIAGCAPKDAGTVDLKSEEDLPGLTVSTSAGNYFDTKYSGRKDISLFLVNSEADGIQAVRQGIADVHVTDEVAFSQSARERLGIKLAFRGEEHFDVAFAARKGNKELVEQMNRFIEASRADGSLDAVISHWLNGTPAPAMPAPAENTNQDPLRCVTAINMEPVCFLGEGGEWMGMDADILRRFAAWSGRRFQMNFQDLGSAIIAMNTGQCDVVSACLYITEERLKSVDFTIPYYKCRPGYFVLDRGNSPGMSIGERLRMNLVTEGRWKLIVDGLWETLKITLLSILLGTLLGMGVCAMLRSRRSWVRKAAGIYGAFIQGIPTLVLLLIMFYVVFANAGLSGTFVAIVTFALCFAWSSGSIFDSAISSVPAGQTEAGLSLGFTPLRTFTGIVFPQALKNGLPLYAGECVALLKSTSIVGYIAIMDLTRASDLIRSRTFDAFIPLLIVTVAYFVLAWLLRLLLNLFLSKK